MVQVAERVDNLSYGIRDARLDKLIEEAGSDLIYCTLGNPPAYGLYPPLALRLAVARNDLRSETGGYATSTNCRNVAEAIASFEAARGVPWAHDFQFAAGSSNVIAAFLMAYLNEGDEVLVPRYLYPLYIGYFSVLGVVPRYYDYHPQTGLIDAGSVEQLITDKTRLFLLIDPCNPFPVVQSKRSLRKLVDLLRPHGDKVMVLHDLAYDCMTYPDCPHLWVRFASLIERDDPLNVFVTCTFSKLWRWCSKRCGWGFFVGSQAATKALSLSVSELISMNLGGDRAAIQAIPLALRLHRYMDMRNQVSLSRRRDALLSAMHGAKGFHMVKPQGAIYGWLRHEHGPNKDVQEALIRRGLLLTDGNVFGPHGEGYLRMVMLPQARAMKRAGRILKEFGERPNGR
ncbi:pyridoxal phosphate-dependent aminotransferase [Patescibacteria group bacterium]